MDTTCNQCKLRHGKAMLRNGSMLAVLCQGQLPEQGESPKEMENRVGCLKLFQSREGGQTAPA